MRRLLTPLVLASAGSGVIGSLLHFAFERMDHRVVPWLDRLPWAFAIGAWIPVPVLLAEFVRWRPSPIARAGLAIVVQALLAAGMSYAVIASEPGFPFAPVYVGKLALPDGDRTAYLYQTGIGCSYDIFVGRSGALTLDFSRHVPRKTCTPRSRDARLVWDTQRSQVGVVDEDGRPIP